MQIFSNKKGKIRLNQALFFVSALLLLGVSFWFGVSCGKGNVPILRDLSSQVVNKETNKPSQIDFSVYWEAWNKLVEKAVVKPDQQKMIYGSISGMLSSLNDPYTVFFTPEDAKRFREDIQGEFDGIGVELILKNGIPTVVAPLSKTPAEAAGMLAGDIIVEVDGSKTDTMGFNEVIDKIRGKKGTKVTLKIVREGKDDPIVVDVVRDTIIVKSVEWEFKDEGGKKIGIVNIRQFGDDTNSLFDQFAAEAIKNKADGIVVDLRNNPGGYLESAITLSSYFVDGGTIVQEKDRADKIKDYNANKKATLKNIRTAVLVNKGSASASEIFSGALQDRKAGKIIGEKTFGKGCVQEIIELSDQSAVKITVANWLTPNGRAINGEGITPDITIAKTDDTKIDNQLERAIQFLTKGE